MHCLVAALVLLSGFVSLQCMGFGLNHHGRIINSNSLILRPYDTMSLYATKKKRKKQGSNSSSKSSSRGFASKTRAPKPTTATDAPSSTEQVPPPPPPRIRALQQVSSEPLIFTIDDFVSEEACLALQQQSEEARLNFCTLVAGELFSGQWGPNDGLRLDESTSSSSSSSSSHKFPQGLHVDTNNDSKFRSVTLILYLNDIDSSSSGAGATVFPLANAPDNAPALAAARRLLQDGVAHTRGAAGSGGVLPHQEADAKLLEDQTEHGLSVQPQTGRLCIFFSRTADGEIDARSWHGGERLVPAHNGATIEKKIMTLFKEVSYYGAEESRPKTYETTFEAYMAPQIAEQRSALQSLAESHAVYFE